MRPALEVADIFRRHGDAFRAAQGSRLSCDQRRVMAAIAVCRTAALERGEPFMTRDLFEASGIPG
jgi:hypothetical protein